MKNNCPGYDGIPAKIWNSSIKHKKGMEILMDSFIKQWEGKLTLGIKNDQSIPNIQKYI